MQRKGLKGYVYTFRSGDVKLGGRAQVVYAKDHGAARDIMFSQYGDDWAFQYELDAWLRDMEDPSYPVTLEMLLPFCFIQVVDSEMPEPHYIKRPYVVGVADE